MCPCDKKNKEHHDLDLSPELFAVLTLDKQQKLSQLGHQFIPNIRCPICVQPIIHPYGAKVFLCSRTECINPPYGYCIRCQKGIKDPSSHTCRNKEDEEMFLDYIASHGIRYGLLLDLFIYIYIYIYITPNNLDADLVQNAIKLRRRMTMTNATT
jgi:hypothetical protein